jgi:acetyl-CoA carboxylase carboxyl transferase subunit alpha
MEEYLDFEYKIEILGKKISELKETGKENPNLDFEKEIDSLHSKYLKLLKSTYEELTPWQKVSVARHAQRPHALDYLKNMVKDFVPLAGDRLFGEDAAIVGGIGKIKNKSFVIIGIEKGYDVETRIKHNFGMPKPEGYRKAQRLMHLADKLNLPVVTLIDTSGAYPGKDAEERGQGEAIAKSIASCLEINVPLISIIIGEGGSGGAIALGAGDMVLMLEHSIYSIISPEGCASILYRDEKMAPEAAKSLGLTAQDLLEYKIIDKIIKEPIGGAHRDKDTQYQNVANAIDDSLSFLNQLNPRDRKLRKHQRYLNIGKLLNKK